MEELSTFFNLKKVKKLIKSAWHRWLAGRILFLAKKGEFWKKLSTISKKIKKEKKWIEQKIEKP